MKIRNCFVSNSSSCSFTCPVCDNGQIGDMCDSDPICEKCGAHIEVERKKRKPKQFMKYLEEKFKFNSIDERMQFEKMLRGE